MKKKGPNPWNKIDEKYHIGDIVTVKVVKIMPFGAFCTIRKRNRRISTYFTNM